MSHTRQDRISLEIARRIAAELPRRPDWLDLARGNLDRWARLNGDAPGLLRCYQEWRELLSRPLDDVRRALTAETEEGARVRQNSPFAGALSAQEVWEIKRRLWNDKSAA